MDDLILHWKTSLKPKQRRRVYQHFDSQLDLDNTQHFEKVAKTIKNLNIHEFLPFIKFSKKEIRYRKNKPNKALRSIKERPIMYASHLDAHLYSFYSLQWSEKYEVFIKQHGIDANVIAYRTILNQDDEKCRGKNNINFAKEVFQSIQVMGDCIVVVADISRFFDSLNHRILKEQLCSVLGVIRLSQNEYKVLRSLMSYRYVLKDTGKERVYAKLISQITRAISKRNYSMPQAVYKYGRGIIKNNKTPVGIPQGSPVSGLLANIYLSAFDCGFKEKFPHVTYRRYSDDIVLICTVSEADEVFDFLLESIEVFSLEIHPTKALRVHFQKQTDGSVICVDVRNGKKELVGRRYLDYLGFEFDGQNVLLRGRTLQRAYKKGAAKIVEFSVRGTKDNPRKKHNVSSRTTQLGKGNTYINRSNQSMMIVGSNIGSQENKMHKFLRKKREESKQSNI